MSDRPTEHGLVFAGPWLVGFVVLSLVPMLGAAALSLTQWDGLSGDFTYVGLDHYRTILANEPGDPRFVKAVENSLVYTAMAVPLGLAVALGLALLLNVPLRGISLFRTIFYLPHVLSGVAVILMFQWMFNPDFGLINASLRGIARAIDPLTSLAGVTTADWIPPRWFYSETWCKPALAVMHAFGAGGAMLIFLAALQDVPEHLLDAAKIDGAGPWQRFRAVTLPHISPAILFNLLIGILAAMQTFNQAYLLSHYSQRDGLLLYVLYIYQKAFEDYRFGYAAALSWILFALLFVISTTLLATSKRWVHYSIR